MHKRLSLTFSALLFIALSLQTGIGHSTSIANAQSRSIPAPEEVLGFRPGDDRKLASWAQVVAYFQKLAANSDRVKFAEIGKSTMGAPFVYATISAPENLRRIDEFKEIYICPLGKLLKQFELNENHTFRLFIKPFMDASTWDEDRIDRCCTPGLERRRYCTPHNWSGWSWCRHSFARIA